MAPQDNSPATGLLESFAAACGMVGPLEIAATHRATGAKQSHRVDQPFAFVGRAPSMGVRLDDPSVSQCHAYLQVVGGVPYCIDLGSRAGVVWDDGGQCRGWVNPGRTLRVGMFDIVVGGPGVKPAPAAVPDGELDPPAVADVHVPEGGPVGRQPLDRPVTLVGRHPHCDLRLLNDGVPYFQCALVGTRDGVWCVDIWSPKGTVLNGRATRLARVNDGDLVEVGRAFLVVRTGPESIRPPAPDVAADPLTAEALEAISRTVLESVSGVIAPFREVMGHYQQCLTTMTQTLETMRQEHTSVIGEQVRQVQELTRELRELLAGVEQGSAAARTLAATQQEHALAVGEQMRQVQDLIRELRADVGRERATSHPSAAPAKVELAPPSTAAAPPPPTPAVAQVPRAQASIDVQTWSLDRLAMTVPPQFGTLARAGPVQRAGAAQTDKNRRRAEEDSEKQAGEAAAHKAEAERVAGRSAEWRQAEIEMGNEILSSVLNERRARLGPDHPDTLATLNDLAAGYRDAGQWEKALPLLEESLRLRTAGLGPDHPDTLAATGDLAGAYLAVKQVDESLSLLERYVPKMRDLLGAGTPRFVGLLGQMGHDLLAARQYAVAESYLRECLTALERSQPDAWVTNQVRSLLGGSLLGQQKYADAEPLLLAGYQGMKRLEATAPPQGKHRLREAADRLAELYAAAGQPEQAARWRAESGELSGPAPGRAEA